MKSSKPRYRHTKKISPEKTKSLSQLTTLVVLLAGIGYYGLKKIDPKILPPFLTGNKISQKSLPQVSVPTPEMYKNRFKDQRFTHRWVGFNVNPLLLQKNAFTNCEPADVQAWCEQLAKAPDQALKVNLKIEQRGLYFAIVNFPEDSALSPVQFIAEQILILKNQLASIDSIDYLFAFINSESHHSTFSDSVYILSLKEFKQLSSQAHLLQSWEEIAALLRRQPREGSHE
jgi:hypothetical protein